MNPYHRTHKTNLSNQELLLLDFLFDKAGATLGLLSNDAYPLHMNCRYTHGLNDEQLAGVMTDLSSRHIVDVRKREIDDNGGFWLTVEGGALWAAERLPDWNRYCVDSQGKDEELNQETLTISCLHESVGRELLRVGRECGLFMVAAEPVVETLTDSYELVYWRAFEVCRLKVALPSDEADGNEPPWPNWTIYERERTWWRTLSELLPHVAEGSQ